MSWQSGETPPEGPKGLWTEDVVVMTNLGRVCKLAFHHPDTVEGAWQRPSYFEPGEAVYKWIHPPD